MNSQFGGGSFGTSSSGMRGTGAVDFSIVCNSHCIILCTLPCLYIRNLYADKIGHNYNNRLELISSGKP